MTESADQYLKPKDPSRSLNLDLGGQVIILDSLGRRRVGRFIAREI